MTNIDPGFWRWITYSVDRFRITDNGNHPHESVEQQFEWRLSTCVQSEEV